ncbi:hypothetical protein IWX63_000712 [Arthrobacter sp. CAN_A2]
MERLYAFDCPACTHSRADARRGRIRDAARSPGRVTAARPADPR